jgi:hypothetical protein
MPLLEPITFENVPIRALFQALTIPGLPEELPHSFSGLHPIAADAHGSGSFAPPATCDVHLLRLKPTPSYLRVRTYLG